MEGGPKPAVSRGEGATILLVEGEEQQDVSTGGGVNRILVKEEG